MNKTLKKLHSLKIKVEDKDKAFLIARKLFKSTFTFWYELLVIRCVPSLDVKINCGKNYFCDSRNF